MPSLNTYIGSLFYVRATTSGNVLGQINVQGTYTCGTPPAYALVDLGTVITTAFSSATVITNSGFNTSPGIGSWVVSPGAIPLTGGHFYGFGYTAGVCTAFPRVDIELTAW
jgi:hypothetical protein